MRSEGKGSISLFNIQSPIEKELSVLGAQRLFEKLGIAKPTSPKIVQSFEIPLIPKQEDFFLFPFRHLSATVVGGGTYKATDFSKEGILKKAYGLLRGKPAYLNHVQLVGKSIGVVGDTEWVGPYKNSKGDLIPGGIEGPFVIDSILNPELVRQLSSPVSPIDSCSVTVVFEWEASHEFEHDHDFYWHLGEIIDDGSGPEMVRRIVTKIISFEESSLVWMGADPYAKILSGKGEVVNIDRAQAYAKNKFSADPDNAKWDPEAKYFVFDCLDKDFLLHLSKTITDLDKPKPDKNIITMDKELLNLLASLFKTSPENITNGTFKKADAEKFVVKDSAEFSKMKSGEDFEKEVSAKTKVEGELATTKTQLTKVEGEKKALEDAAVLAKPLSELGTATLKAARDEAKRVYGILAKGKEDKTITDELEAETSIEKLNAKIKLFGGQAVNDFGGKCSECGSNKIDFRSSGQTDENDPTKKGSNSGRPNLADGLRR